MLGASSGRPVVWLGGAGQREGSSMTAATERTAYAAEIGNAPKAPIRNGG
ncbi:MAG: hypothetical protein JWP61_2790 [Friedmanniella sp.]|nr:hypothetical protein [Friedmanniella sp.]